jgi:hypothetical protein
MENPVSKHPNIRRREDGSIDIDFYRQAGLTERRLVITNFARGLKKVHRGVIAALLLAAALYSSRDGTGSNQASTIGARNNSMMLQPLPTTAQRYAMRTAQ